MRCMAICGDDYRIFDSVAKARKWGKGNYDALGKRTEIYHLDRFENLGALYDVVPYLEVVD